MSGMHLLVTAILLVPVVGLLVFVGCRWRFDPLRAPTGLYAIGQCDARVEVSWNPVAGADRYDLIRVDKGSTPIYSGSAPSFSDTDVDPASNQAGPCYRVRVHKSGAVSDYSAQDCLNARMSRPFVSAPQGYLSLTAAPTGFVGMKIELGANPATRLEVCALGRFLAPDNGKNPDQAVTTHRLRIVDAVRDVDVASALISTAPNGPDFLDPKDSYGYVRLPSPVILAADSVNPDGLFYVVSEERNTSTMHTPELLGDGDTPVTSTVDGFVIASVSGNTGAWIVHRTGSFAFGPTNFRYKIASIVL